MGFPALTWDYTADEPYCTGCMVCVRECPTQCMSATMKDNPQHPEGKSKRRKIIDEFEINLNAASFAASASTWCNFDAIEKSHEARAEPLRPRRLARRPSCTPRDGQGLPA